MSLLIIRFHDANIDEFTWCISRDAESGSQEFEWLQDSEAGLASLLSRHKHEVVFVIPQECIYLTQYDVPEKASRQILAAIEYQIEDQLGADLEQQHFAISDASSNRVAIAVVKKSIMQRCVYLQKQYNIALSRIVPEVFLCPWSGMAGEVSVSESFDALVIRWGHYEGLKCRPELLESMLDLIDRDSNIQLVNYYTLLPEAYERIKIEKYGSQGNSAAIDQSKFLQSALIDLKQREFKQSSLWRGVITAWKWVGLLLLMLSSVLVYNKAVALQEMEMLLADIKLSQYEIIKAYLPAGVSPDDNLKSEFIKVLASRQQGQQKADFLTQLQIFTRAFKTFSSISILKIGYQKYRLNIDISSSRLADIEALQKNLESTSLKVRLDNLNIKPDVILGRLVLEST